VFLAALLAEAYGRAERADRALEVVREALKAVEARAAAADAEACFRRAVATARAVGARSLELRAATSLARRLADRGARTEAREALAPVLASFSEGHDTHDLRTAAGLVSEIG
jgi:adenylate cyclase